MIGDWPERDVVGAKNWNETAFAVYGDTLALRIQVQTGMLRIYQS